ncbi:MAG: hypothetical protein GVY30_00120 [Chloroflexi bacterium]|jgi:hypothetical protein|nr:hypothetical protein [Chloroflexota bacterium]
MTEKKTPYTTRMNPNQGEERAISQEIPRRMPESKWEMIVKIARWLSRQQTETREDTA